MSEDILGHDNSMWDDQSWPFPNLGSEEENGATKLAGITINSDGQVAAKDDEAPPPPPPASKGKKRSAAGRKAQGGGNDDEEKGGGDSDHELHIWTERERRKKMRNMFANLHALLPHLPPKADKSTIVDEAVNYIKKLETTLEKLQKQKLERFQGLMMSTHHNPILINYDNPSLIITKSALFTQSREAFPADHQGSASNSAVALASPNPPLFLGVNSPPVFKTWTSPNVILNINGRDAHISVCCPKKTGLLTTVCFVLEKHKLEVVSAQASADSNRCMFMIHVKANGGSDQLQQAFSVEDIYKQAAAEIMIWVNA